MNYESFEKLQKDFPSLDWKDIQRIIKNRNQDQWTADANALKNGTPWEYICETADFGPISFDISSPLLIPREETWDWLEQAYLTIGPVSSLLDLGCGPGTLSLGWIYLQNSPCRLTAIDLNPIAIKIASQNLHKRGAPDWECYQSDWLDQVPSQSFDLILSNPPYCDQSQISFIEKSHEDPHARFAKYGGLEPYLRIFERALKFLEPSGQIVIEHGVDQGLAICKLGVFFGLSYKNHYHDQRGGWRATHFQVYPL